MHAGPKINQAGRCLPRYARISIKRHGSNQRVEVPVPLAGGGLPTLSNALPVSARNLYGPTLLPAVEKTAALPSSKFGISRPLNILRGYFAPQNAPLPSLPPCASAVPVASPRTRRVRDDGRGVTHSSHSAVVVLTSVRWRTKRMRAT